MRFRHVLATLSIALAGCMPAGSEMVPPAGGGTPDSGTIVVSMGEVPLGGAATASFLIRNPSTGPTFLYPVEVEAPFSSDVVALEKVPAGSSRQVTFTFAPTEVGAAEVVVYLRSSGSVRKVRLSGTGTEAEGCVPTDKVDVFPEVRPRIDLLFVLDDHTSMDAFRDGAVARALELPPHLFAQGIDYRVAVTSSGVGEGCNGGLLLPVEAPAVIGPDTERSQELLQSALQVPVCGGNSRGLQAAAQVAEGSQLGFPREDAALVLAVISTRDDRSVDPVATLGRRLLAAKEKVRAIAVVGPDDGSCDGSEPGKRYGEAVSFLGGFRHSLCKDADLTADFPAGSNFGMPAAYPLGATPGDVDGDGVISPVAGEIVVSVDGEPLPDRDEQANRIWSWDPVRNAIVFQERFGPAPGSTVEVRYRSACALER